VNAVIIGGSGGIGRAVSCVLAEKVTSLCIHAGHESDKFNSLAASLAHKTRVTPIVHSFSLEKGLESFLNDFYHCDLYQHLLIADIICICYGPFLQKSVHEMKDTEWIESSFFNFTLPGIIMSLVLPSMMERKFGRIIVFGGTKTEALRSFKTNPVYGASKTALCSLVKSVASQYSSYGITCNAVLPGFVDTEYVSSEEKLRYEALSPGKKMIDVHTVADAVMFLIENPAVSGTLLTVDGGLNI
jgi:NAD(P)-dependent dehydrogenase (short-subunit alcohol dehydrogenase family)